MRAKWTQLLMVGLAACLVTAGFGLAQSATTDEGKRKIKSRVAPVYPELARRMSVTGKVKIEVVITPDGHVKSSRILGGHPLLVQACEDAVKEWKFLPAGEESTQIVEFDFHGGS